MARKKWWALIWWVDEAKKDVLRLSSIPPKHRQVDGSDFFLIWKDVKTKTEIKAKAKLLAKSQDEKELHRQNITVDGVVNDNENKIFSHQIHQDRQSLVENAKLAKEVSRSAKNQIDATIEKDDTIIPHSLTMMNTLIRNEYEKSYEDPYENTYTDAMTNIESVRPASTNISPLKNACLMDLSLPVRMSTETFDSTATNTVYQECIPPKPVSSPAIAPLDEGALEDHHDAVSENGRPASNSHAMQNSSYVIQIGKVTLDDIRRQEQLLQCMREAYADQQNMNVQSVKTFEVPNKYFVPGLNKTEISCNSGVYLPSHIYKLINDKAEINTDWRIIVRDALLEFYDGNIADFSATGKRTNRPPLNGNILKGIKEWVNTSPMGPVQDKEIFQCIGHTSANKRTNNSQVQKKQKTDHV